MDEIFDNIFVLIPVALVIAARIFNARQKHANREQKTSAPPPPPPVQKPKAPEESRPHWEVPDWPDTKKKQPAIQPKPAIRLETENDPEQLIKRILSGSSQPAKPVKTKKPLKAQVPKQALFPEPERSPANAGLAAKTKSPVSAAPETGPGFFAADLSPLQTAMVWSEILGPPRSETL